MRRLALTLLISAILASAACGGGDGGDSASSDTGESAIGSVTETPPPVTTTEGGKAFQITVPKAGHPIGPQSPAKNVKQVQKAMNTLGYDVGTPDGVYGEKTLKAVRKFQKKQNLGADGLVGVKTAKAINKALKQQASS
jgi:peptidoglycan hydrolase-like protein with peptidoglycan-binding domain